MKPSAPLETPMITDCDKPDISILVRSGHFYFGLTIEKERVAEKLSVQLE